MPKYKIKFECVVENEPDEQNAVEEAFMILRSVAADYPDYCDDGGTTKITVEKA